MLQAFLSDKSKETQKTQYLNISQLDRHFLRYLILLKTNKSIEDQFTQRLYDQLHFFCFTIFISSDFICILYFQESHMTYLPVSIFR